MNGKNIIKGRGSLWIILFLVVAVVSAGGVIAWMMTHQPKAPDIDPAIVTFVDKDAMPVPNESIEIPGYPAIVADSTGVIQTAFKNPEGNPCYFKVELVTSDTGQTLWGSRLIPPGAAIDHPKMTSSLEPGTYNVILKYKTFGTEDEKEMNGAEINTQLTIQ